MEDDNGLELSLGLSLCRSSAKSKDKTDNSSDTRTDEGDRSNKLINDFRNVLEGGTRKQESSTGSQSSDPARPDDNFSNNFSNSAADIVASRNFNGKGLWVANDKRGIEMEEEKRVEAGNKRKTLFDEINQKKRERVSHNSDLHDKCRQSHISINTDDESTADNEDVADSEVVRSTSRLFSHHDNGAKKYIRDAGPSEVSKEVHTVIDSSVGDLQGQKRFTVSSEKEVELRNMSYGVPFPAQSVNILNMPYPLPVKDSSSVGVIGTPGYPLPGMVQVTAAANSERPGTQTLIPGNVPAMFGHSPIQLPVLDKDNSRGLASHPQQIHPSYAGRVPPNSDEQIEGLKISRVEQAKGDGKQHAADGGSSSQTEDGLKRSNIPFGLKDESDKPRPEGFPFEVSAIRPGIAEYLKFGGCDSHSHPSLVSTKGPGPNGKTISGVTYRNGPTQIKIVCACHGSHMEPRSAVPVGCPLPCPPNENQPHHPLSNSNFLKKVINQTKKL